MPGAARTLNDSFQLTFPIGILENLPQSTCRHFLRLVATNWDEVVEIRVDVLVVAFPFFLTQPLASRSLYSSSL